MFNAVLMTLCGLVFASTANWWLLLSAAFVGAPGLSRPEMSPFLSIEQAVYRTPVTTNNKRTLAYAWYNTVARWP
jgi:hypothetical protein